MKIRVKNFFNVNFILVLQFLLYTIYYFEGSRLCLYLNPMLGAVVFVDYFLKKRDKREKQVLIIGCLACAFSMLGNIIFSANYGLELLVREILTYTVTALLLTYDGINRKIMLTLFYGFAAFTWYKLIIIGAPFNIFYYQSRNYIGVYLMIALFPYYSTFLNCNSSNSTGIEQPSLIPAVICLVTSVYTLGRGSIVMSVSLVAFTCLKNIFLLKKGNVKKAVLAIGIIVVAITIIQVTDVSENYLYRFFDAKVSSNEQRGIIWKAYLHEASTDFFGFLFGVNMHSNYVLDRFLGNSHNSYLMLHAYFGIVLFCMIIVSLTKCMIRLCKNNLDLVIYLFAFLVRGLTDWMFAAQWGDIVVIYFLMILFLKKIRGSK